MHLRPLVLTTAFAISALVGCSRDELAPWGFADDVRLECASPSRGQVGVAYSYTPEVVTGVEPLSFAVEDGTSLPDGLTVDAATGEISGTPTVDGTFPLVLIVTDARGNDYTITCGDIVIEPGAGIDCRDEPGDIPDGYVGLDYDYEPTVAGGRPPYVLWTDNGTLPPGLTIAVDTGRITGVPTQTGVFNVTLEVTDADLQVITTDCGVLEIRDPIQVDTESLLGVFPDGCITHGVDIDELIAEGIVIPVKDASDPPLCELKPGRGKGSRNFDGNADTPDTMPPGIAVDASTCVLSGTIDSKLRFGAYAWITTISQAGTEANLPYCAPQSVQAGTAYGVERTDGGVENSLAPGHIVFDLEADPNMPSFAFGTTDPDPQVTVTYNANCGGSCFYSYIFAYNALSGDAAVSGGPSSKFPDAGFEGFTHAIRVTETNADFLRSYGKKAFVTNLSFDYCIAQNEDDCGNNEDDPAAKGDLIRANGGGSNYEFGLIVLPQN